MYDYLGWELDKYEHDCWYNDVLDAYKETKENESYDD